MTTVWIPPIVGHLILADEAYADLRLDKLLWVLTQAPPHKRDRSVTPLEHRLAMLQAMIGPDDRFQLSRVDIDRQPPHYAVDTLRLLEIQYPADHLIYLMGGDSLRDLPSWFDPQGFILAADELGVMQRPGAIYDLADLEKKLPGLSAKTTFIEAPLIDIASSQFRNLSLQGKPFRYYLHPAVYGLIQDRGLFKRKF